MCILLTAWFSLTNRPLDIFFFSFKSFLYVAILFQHLETWWLSKPQKEHKIISHAYVEIYHALQNQKEDD